MEILGLDLQPGQHVFVRTKSGFELKVYVGGTEGGGLQYYHKWNKVGQPPPDGVINLDSIEILVLADRKVS